MLLYSHGIGVPKDESQALRWVHKAAELGTLGAYGYLGSIYGDGLMGVTINKEISAEYYRLGEKVDAKIMSEMQQK